MVAREGGTERAFRARRSDSSRPARPYAQAVDRESPPVAGLPGAELALRGIADLELGVESVESLLVSIGAARLERLGFRLAAPIPAPEHRLYALLAAEDADSAHARYNALIRRLVSFERAAECAS
jgi:hypothetical protein